MASPVQIVVNGLSGPRCTIEASTEWTVLQVQHAICEMISVPASWQTLVKDTKKLHVEATVGSLLPDEATTSLQLMLIVEEVHPIKFVGMQNGLEQLEPGHLRKTGGANGFFNATAVSSEGLIVGEGCGLRFRPGSVDKWFMIGLGSEDSAPRDHSELDYAALCRGDGQVLVVEREERMSVGCAYGENSIVELRINGDRVEFRVGGYLEYTSQLRGETELYVMAAFSDVGAEALEIQWL